MARLLMQVTGNWQTQLFQVYQSEESSKIIINAHTTICPLHKLPITTASTLIGHLISCCNLVFIAPILHLMVVCGCRSHWRFSPLCVQMLSFVCLLFIKLNQLEKLECAGKYFDNYKYFINLKIEALQLTGCWGLSWVWTSECNISWK